MTRTEKGKRAEKIQKGTCACLGIRQKTKELEKEVQDVGYIQGSKEKKLNGKEVTLKSAKLPGK